jgi:hypothetical protein
VGRRARQQRVKVFDDEPAQLRVDLESSLVDIYAALRVWYLQEGAQYVRYPIDNRDGCETVL